MDFGWLWTRGKVDKEFGREKGRENERGRRKPKLNKEKQAKVVLRDLKKHEK